MDINKGIGLELRMISNKIKYETARINFLSDTKLTTMQSWVIAFLYQNRDRDIYQKDCEVSFDMNRSTASQMIRSMERHGLITRESVKHDARLKKLILTPKAIDFFESQMDVINSFEGALLAGFSDDEVNNLYDYINRIKHNLDSLPHKD